MKLFGWDISRERKDSQFESVLMRLLAVQEGIVGTVTPENCMESPTVHAIVTAVSRRMSVTPVHVYRTSIDANSGIQVKEKLSSHPVALLLKTPNEWQSRADYWQDAGSAFLRYGGFIAIKGRGATGPIRRLWPVIPKDIEIKQDPDSLAVTFKRYGTKIQEWPLSKVHYARSQSRNFVKGDSPINDVQGAIAAEIAAQRFANSFYQNGAVPLMIFKYLAGVKGFKTPEEEQKFIQQFQDQFSGSKRHKGMLLPPGMDITGFPIENDKAQFIETRRYQRTVIAGAFGVPPHLVGDLERATFNNVEQQDQDFTSNVMQPIWTAFESAMERDLLTQEDRDAGIIIRANLDSILRADFKSRQEGLQIQRQNGVINANEWRERESMNPMDEDDGGDTYIIPANFQIAVTEPPELDDAGGGDPNLDPNEVAPPGLDAEDA